MELFHGSHTNTEALIVHEGICLCETEEIAEQYAQKGAVYLCELDGGLNFVRVPGYDHDENDCPADHEEYRAQMAAEGADVLVYEDEDEMGREHTCYRLVSQAALNALSVIE